MKPGIEQVAESFSRHGFQDTYPYLADDIVWNIVGNTQIVGKNAVISACDESAAYLKSATTTFRTFRLIVAADCVVTDTTAEYVGGDGDSSTIASCDIYRFCDGMLCEITSYTLELS